MKSILSAVLGFVSASSFFPLLTSRVNELPEGYDPTVIRSGPPSRGGQRRVHRGLNVCGCGFRTRRLLRYHQHHCKWKGRP